MKETIKIGLKEKHPYPRVCYERVSRHQTYPLPPAPWECPRCHHINGPHIGQCMCRPDGQRWTTSEPAGPDGNAPSFKDNDKVELVARYLTSYAVLMSVRKGMENIPSEIANDFHVAMALAWNYYHKKLPPYVGKTLDERHYTIKCFWDAVCNKVVGAQVHVDFDDKDAKVAVTIMPDFLHQKMIFNM